MMDGIIDMKILIHKKMDQLLALYGRHLGKHIVPPFWSMGYIHYEPYRSSYQHYRKRIRLFRKMKVPIDGLFINNLFMSYDYKMFTVDH